MAAAGDPGAREARRIGPVVEVGSKPLERLGHGFTAVALALQMPPQLGPRVVTPGQPTQRRLVRVR